MFVVVLSILLLPVIIRITPSPSKRCSNAFVPICADNMGSECDVLSDSSLVTPNTLSGSPLAASAILSTSRWMIAILGSIVLSVGSRLSESIVPRADLFPEICIFSCADNAANWPIKCSSMMRPSRSCMSKIFPSGSLIPVISGSSIRTTSGDPRLVRKNRKTPSSLLTIPCSPLAYRIVTSPA